MFTPQITSLQFKPNKMIAKALLHLRKTGISCVFLFSLIAFLSPEAVAAKSSRDDVRLVVLVIVDQLRGDFLNLYEDRLAEDGGFRRFLQSGTVFEQALHDHSVTQTAPGHASILTGTQPAYHGIVGNDWFDREAGHRVNAVYDYSTQFVGVDTDAPGRSPNLLRAPTIGDEMVMASDGLAKVMAVSGKDRGAVLAAGRLGKAFWYYPGNGAFVSSSYYFDSGLPGWVKSANTELGQFAPTGWSLFLGREAYRRAAHDNRPYEAGPVVSDIEFPHELPDRSDKRYSWWLKLTPHLDQKTLDFSATAIGGAGLGDDQVTDLLVVSLSSTDYVGHYYGWYSLEAEDNFLRLDRALGRFFDKVDAKVGQGKTLFVLTSDHGTDAIPAYKNSMGMPAYRLVDTEVLSDANEALSKQYGVNDALLSSFIVPNMYIDRDAVERNNLSFKDVLSSTMVWLEKQKGIEKAIDVSKLPFDSDYRWSQLVKNSVLPSRSGDIYVIQSHSTYLEWANYNAAHGSPHHYDRHVPLMFTGPEIKRHRSPRQVTIPSLAPTIANYLNVPVPAYAVGVPLHEITAPLTE